MTLQKTAEITQPNSHPDADTVASMRPTRLLEAVTEGLRRLGAHNTLLITPPSFQTYHVGKKNAPEGEANSLHCAVLNKHVKISFYYNWKMLSKVVAGYRGEVMLPPEYIAQLMALLAGRGGSFTWRHKDSTIFSACRDHQTGNIEMTIATEVRGFKLDGGTLQLPENDGNELFTFLYQHLLAWMPPEEEVIEAPSFGLSIS